MVSYVRFGRLVVVWAFGGSTAIAAACTGSDTTNPAPAPSSSGGVEAGTGTSSGTTPSGDAGTYGVFLTHETFLPDYGTASTDDDRFAFVDGKCIDAAKSAGLANSERYKAVVTMYPKNADLDLPRLLKFGTIGQKDGARWCAIFNTPTPHADCTVGDGALIFGNSLDVQLGPIHPLFSDENGNVQQQTAFFSGFLIPPGKAAAQGGIRNCNGWTTKIPSLNGDAAPDGVEYAFGYGTTQAVPRTPAPTPFAWLATPAYCEDRYRLPLLCIEVPSSD